MMIWVGSFIIMYAVAMAGFWVVGPAIESFLTKHNWLGFGEK